MHYKIHDLFAVKYKVLPHPFAITNCNKGLYKQHWYFINWSALYKPINTEQDTYKLPFSCNLDFMCLVSAHTLTNIKQVPKFKEPDPVFSSLIIIVQILKRFIKAMCVLWLKRDQWKAAERDRAAETKEERLDWWYG